MVASASTSGAEPRDARDLWPADPVQRVALVLMRRGHYQDLSDAKYPVHIEDPDTVEWMRVDAENFVRCLNEKGHTIRVAWDALVDTGLHDPDQPDQARCLMADVEALHKALTDA
jgi:hypothetical protein